MRVSIYTERFPYFYLQVLVFILMVSCSFRVEIEMDRPNLLFIFPDQFRNASIGINGEDPVQTPNLDRLAREGMIISNAISNYPLCSPYRGMLMTGKLPYNNSILSNCNSNRFKYNNTWQKDDISISDVLVKNGYDAGFVGKLHLTSPAPILGKDTVIWNAYTPKEERHGFNFWYSYGTFNQHNQPRYWINDAEEDDLVIFDEWSPKHEADVIIDYIENESDQIRDHTKPFALFWALNPPHPPYQYVPEKYLEPYNDKTYEELLVRDNVDLQVVNQELSFHDGASRNLLHLPKEHVHNHFAMITGIDEQIGRVVEVLKEHEMEKNTIVIITSDHGEMMGSHGLMSKNVWYEESINIPFIIKWPKAIKPNQRKDYLISVTDLMPTLLAMMGIEEGIPNDLDGQNLSSLILHGKGDEPQEALYYFIEEGKPSSGFRGIRTHTNTFVITIDNDGMVREFLYDNVKDIYQKKNIAKTEIELRNQLHALLIKALNEKKDPWLGRYHALNPPSINSVIEKSIN